MPGHQADDPVMPACGPDDLVVEVSWERDGTGLRGRVTAENVSDRACPAREQARSDAIATRSDAAARPHHCRSGI